MYGPPSPPAAGRTGRSSTPSTYYVDQLQDPERYETGPDGKRDVLGPEPKRYVMIEESRHDGRFWVETFETRTEAARYRETSEASDDWYVLHLVDLDTGRQFHAEQTTKFVPDVEGPSRSSGRT